MSKPIRRGGKYYIRRRVPLDLVADFGGKTEIVRALGTADHALAKMLCTAADAAFNEEFALKRASKRTGQSLGTGPIEQYGDPEHNPTIEQELDDRAEALADKVVHKLADVIADRVMLRVEDLKLRLGLSSTPTRPSVPVAMAPPTPQPAASLALPSPASSEDRSLDALYRLWLVEREPGGKTADAYRRGADRFLELVGDKPVPAITKADIVTFKDRLLAAGHSKQTARANIGHVQTLLRFAMGRAWIEINVAEGVTVTDKAKSAAKAARPPMDLGTMRRLFSSKVYTEGYRPEMGAGEAVYWLPYLGLYTGARIEELCQLRPSDVYEESYRLASGKTATVWVLRITADEEDGLGVKNSGSIRRIPIHPELLRLGFIEYVKTQTGSRIFPLLRKGEHGLESTKWSRWWHKEYFRRYCAPSHPKMVFHSFRHTFKDVCREVGIDSKVADAIQGHTDGSASGNYGGEFYPLRPLVEAMERFEVHGLN